MAESEYINLLDQFSKGNIHEKHNSLRKLIALRKHNQASKEKLFKIGTDQIVKIANDPSSNQVDRLLSVSILSRISSTIKSLRSIYRDYIINALEIELPDLQILKDVDDKAYIGKACSIACPDWISDYAPKAIVHEETGEQVRLAFSIALLKCRKNLDSVFLSIKENLSNLLPTTDEPGNTVAKRLRRILFAFRAAIAETIPNASEDTGKLLYDIIVESFSGVQPPTDKQALIDLGEEVAAIIHEIIKLRFSLSINALTYKGLIGVKKFFDNHSWEKFAENSKSMKFVVQDISESILILARQEIPDNDLAHYLKIAVGDKSKSEKKMLEVSKRPGLSLKIKNWLVYGVFEVPNHLEKSPGESEWISENVFLSDLLVDAIRYRIAEQVGRKSILAETEILNPSLSNEIRRLMNYALGLCDSIESLAKRRGLCLREKIGDEVEYSPIDHEVIVPSNNIRKVRIVRPTVDQIREENISFVIRKGLVEPIK